MKAIIWNARGVQNTPTVSRIKLLIRKHDVCFIAIIEPKAPVSMLEAFRKKVHISGCIADPSAKARI